MDNNIIVKEDIIEEILFLVSTKGEDIDFNKKYIQYFELDELMEIKNNLLNNKEQNKTSTKDYLDEIFNNCS